MHRKHLGRTGVLIPEVGLGTCDYRGGASTLRKGLDAGALFVDTAESYGTEPVIRAAVAGIRDRVFIATKVSPENFGASRLRQSVDGSLLRLGTGILDLVQLHRPSADVPIAETIGTLTDLVREGKVRFIGVSNFSIAQLQEAQTASGRCPIVSNQIRYNLIDRTIEAGLLQFCQASGVTVIAYSPLSRKFDRIHDCDPRGALREISRETGRSEAQVAINWCLIKDGVIAIPKGSTEAHVLDNCGASGWRLSDAQVAVLDAYVQHRRRGRLDGFLRHCARGPLAAIARQTVSYLPRGIRRRLA